MGAFQQSFAALDLAANRVGNALLCAGYGRGRNVAILSSNRPEYAEIHFGAARSGAVLAHLSTRISDGELERIVAGTDIEAVFVDESLAGEVAGLQERVPGLERIVVIGGVAPGGAERYGDFLSGASDDPPPAAVAPGDPCLINFTGGTTGLPKGVVASHESRAIGSVRARREFELKDDDVFCCSTPMFHIAGLLVWFQTGVLNGNTQVLMPRWDAEEFMRLVEEEGVTAAFLVPAQINAVIGHPRFSADRLKEMALLQFRRRADAERARGTDDGSAAPSRMGRAVRSIGNREPDRPAAPVLALQDGERRAPVQRRGNRDLRRRRTGRCRPAGSASWSPGEPTGCSATTRTPKPPPKC